MIAGYSSRTGDTDQVVRSLKHFIGRHKILQFYSDDAPAFVKASKELKVSHDSSCLVAHRIIPTLSATTSS